MEKLVYLSILFLLIMSTGCEDEDDCRNMQIVGHLSNVKAKVIDFNGQFVLTTDSTSLINPGYRIGSNNILVPCGFIPKNLQIDERIVIISGNKTSCCDQLTLPTLRTSFGCKFEISSIEQLTDNSK